MPRPPAEPASPAVPAPAAGAAGAPAGFDDLDADRLRALLAGQRYFADEGLCTAIQLALQLNRPLLLEGEPGVGKTQVAAVLARVLRREPVRLQCFEGLDSGQVLYEWDHARQLLQVRLAESRGEDPGDLYDERYLLERPLLRAVRSGAGAVLLVDEVDRADSEFEAFLLEFLAEFQVTVPELGTVRAARPPVVVLTSNRTRELHDALRRRCLYHWIDFPEPGREREILRGSVPGLEEAAADRLVEAVLQVRTLKLLKAPGVAETIDWARGSAALVDRGESWPVALRRALGLLVKDEEDLRTVRAQTGTWG